MLFYSISCWRRKIVEWGRLKQKQRLVVVYEITPATDSSRSFSSGRGWEEQLMIGAGGGESVGEDEQGLLFYSANINHRQQKKFAHKSFQFHRETRFANNRPYQRTLASYRQQRQWRIRTGRDRTTSIVSTTTGKQIKNGIYSQADQTVRVSARGPPSQPHEQHHHHHLHWHRRTSVWGREKGSAEWLTFGRILRRPVFQAKETATDTFFVAQGDTANPLFSQHGTRVGGGWRSGVGEG